MTKGLSSVKTLSAKEIAKKWNLSLADVSKKIAAGVKVEKEHTKSTRQANEIARDHLGERPDYYDKLNQMEKKPIVKEESGVGGVRGLGYVTGDPAGSDYVEKYINTNSMAYEDENGNRIEYMKKAHHNLHNKLGFKEFDPKKIKSFSNFMTEMTGTEHGIGGDHNPVPDDSEYIKTNMKSIVRDSAHRETHAHDSHHKHHADNGFNAFRHTNMKNHSNKPLAESLGSDYGTAAVPVVGDLTGTSRKVMKVDEVNLAKIKNIASKVPPKVKNAAKVGMALANMATLSQVAGDAAEGRKGVDPKRGIVAATSALPGPVGYGAMGLNYTIKGFDKAREHIRAKQKQMKEQGSPANPSYTERPVYEKRQSDNLSSGEVERGIYETRRVRFIGKQNPADLPPRPADYKPGDFGSKLAREGGIKYPGKKKPSKPIKEEQIDEIKASTVGSAVAKASAERKEITSKKMGNKEIAKWWKRERLVRAGVNKLSGKSKVPASLDEYANTPTNEYTKPYMTKSLVRTTRTSHEHISKPDTIEEPGRGGHVSPTKPIKEETKMDTKELINEALDNILEENLVDMKENLMAALQEKAMEKLEERKKAIAANYFAQ